MSNNHVLDSNLSQHNTLQLQYRFSLSACDFHDSSAVFVVLVVIKPLAYNKIFIYSYENK